MFLCQSSVDWTQMATPNAKYVTKDGVRIQAQVGTDLTYVVFAITYFNWTKTININCKLFHHCLCLGQVRANSEAIYEKK